MNEKTSIKSMLQVLDYTKTNKKWFNDKGLVGGYHTVSIQGERFKGQRDPELRLAKVDYDFAGKRVLDVGCSNGGLLHTLCEEIECGVGVDFNPKCINAANALKAINERSNIHFYTFDLDKEDLSMLNHLILGESVDICFFFNISLWVKRWKDVFSLCSNLSTTMLFEAHGSDKQQSEQLRFVKTVYADVQLLSEQSDDDPTYAKRKMYRCDNKIQRQKLDNTHGEFNFLKVYSEDSVREAYEKAFPGQEIETIHFFPNSHESVVVDINDDYIVKLPRPRRGLDGLNAEQSVTDFMRDKINLPVPALSIHTSPVAIARYQKLQGQVFSKSRYATLSGKDKDGLASQLAEFIAVFHSVSHDQIKEENILLSPSWDISLDLIEEQLSEDQEPVVKTLLKEVVANHRILKVSPANQVFGHFDLHGGNLLVNKSHDQITGVIDFGNCKIGDLHQDLSVMNLSSPDLAVRIALKYEKITGRVLNRLLIQHYTTIFYLNLLAGLARSKDNKNLKYWRSEFNKWYHHLLQDRAKTKLKLRPAATSITNGWRKWLASNLMKGSDLSSLQKVLSEQGFSPVDIATELMLAEEHPYIQAGKDIFHTLNKRNWLLKTYDTLSALDKRYSTNIEKRKCPDFNYFVNEYYSKNLPVVLTGGVDHWPALKKWTPEFLRDQYGDKEIEIQYGREQDPLYERNSAKHKTRILMRDYVDLISQGESNNHYMTANNTKNSFSSLASLFDDVADFSSGYRQGETIRAGNLFWFGPKGTFTPIHYDLTNNMLVQIYGRKKVTLIPGHQVPWLYNDSGVFSASDYPDFDAKRHPAVKNVTPLELILDPGDSLFIPIGWWHCVESLDAAISLSFTNFNSVNNFYSSFPR